MVNRLFCTPIKMLYRTLRGVPCTSLNIQQLLKELKACAETSFLPSRFSRRYGIYYKIAKAERHKNKNKQTKTTLWASPWELTLNVSCVLCSVVCIASCHCFILVPENVSDMKWHFTVCLVEIFFSKGIFQKNRVLVEDISCPEDEHKS